MPESDVTGEEHEILLSKNTKIEKGKMKKIGVRNVYKPNGLNPDKKKCLYIFKKQSFLSI